MKITAGRGGIHDKKDFIAKFYVNKADGKAFDALFAECIKRHYKTRLKKTTRLYFVIEGKGSFVVNGKSESAEPYDLFMIQDGDIYEYSGKMKLIEVNVPATDSTNEEKLE